MDDITESALIKENTSKKNNKTRRNKNKNLNTTNLVSAIFFHHQKIIYSSFLSPMKIC